MVGDYERYNFWNTEIKQTKSLLCEEYLNKVKSEKESNELLNKSKPNKNLENKNEKYNEKI
jgi:hypothetical protein